MQRKIVVAFGRAADLSRSHFPPLPFTPSGPSRNQQEKEIISPLSDPLPRNATAAAGLGRKFSARAEHVEVLVHIHALGGARGPCAGGQAFRLHSSDFLGRRSRGKLVLHASALRRDRPAVVVLRRRGYGAAR